MRVKGSGLSVLISDIGNRITRLRGFHPQCTAKSEIFGIRWDISQQSARMKASICGPVWNIDSTITKLWKHAWTGVCRVVGALQPRPHDRRMVEYRCGANNFTPSSRELLAPQFWGKNYFEVMEMVWHVDFTIGVSFFLIWCDLSSHCFLF